MDNLRPCPGASQPKQSWRSPQSGCSSSHRRNDAATSGVTDCPAHTADGASAPSDRFACVAEKFSWPQGRLTKPHVCSAGVGLGENQETRFVSLMFSEVESHQPFPEHQQVSSGEVPSLSERTFPVSPRLNASASLFAVSSSLAPMQGIITTDETKRASNCFSVTRVTSSMPPRPGLSPTPSGVSGTSNRPPGRKASSQFCNGAVDPALT
jgi:hypothetical protein